MKIAFMADAHARGKDLDVFRRQWDDAFEHVRLRGDIEVVVHCGDLFDSPAIGDKHASPDEVIRSVAAAPAKWARCCVRDVKKPARLIEVTGNHSAANQRHMLFAGASVEARHFDVARYPRWIRLNEETYLAALPWQYDIDAEEALIAMLEDAADDGRDEKTLILAAHMQVLGAKLNALKTCEEGSFTISRDASVLDNFDYIALGDFHMRQRLFVDDNGRDRGGYVGALRQLNFGEEGNPAGFEIYDTETKEVEWIELEAAPKYHTIPWLKGQERPVASSQYERVVATGWTPAADDIRSIEETGARVEIVTDRVERVARAEIKPGILEDKVGLLDLYLSVQSNEEEAPIVRRAKEVLAQ